VESLEVKLTVDSELTWLIDTVTVPIMAPERTKQV
jgi:hypothetical protein